jgi:hypothetical protein
MDEHDLVNRDLDELAEIGITGWTARALMDWRRVMRATPCHNYNDSQWWSLELWRRRN